MTRKGSNKLKVKSCRSYTILVVPVMSEKVIYSSCTYGCLRILMYMLFVGGTEQFMQGLLYLALRSANVLLFVCLFFAIRTTFSQANHPLLGRIKTYTRSHNKMKEALECKHVTHAYGALYAMPSAAQLTRYGGNYLDQHHSIALLACLVCCMFENLLHY